MNEMIKTIDVCYEYKAASEQNLPARAIDGISIGIKQGEFVVVLGRNGSGKSTLARLFNALLIPTDGTVLIDGLDTKNGEVIWDIRKNLGLVFQNPDNQLVSTTVEEDVAFGPENLGIPPREIRQRVDESLKLVGMESYANYPPHMLSGGQKQRIAIAGILAMEPKCIVLDEATSMLDPQGRNEVMDVLTKLNREKGITIVLITHHMNEAVGADRVLVMEKGQVILTGKPRDIFENVETLVRAGLDVPKVTALAHELKKRGYRINGLPVSFDEMVSTLKELLRSHGVSPAGSHYIQAGQSSQIIAPDKPHSGDENEDIIVIKDLSHVYMAETTLEKKALKNINLNIKRGEILGIIGHTGSGKSTLVQHFNGILKATSGSITVDGLSAEKKELKELRRKVGLVFQYPEQQLFEETVYKDIAFGLNNMGLSEEETKKRVFHAIELLGISPELLEKSPFELSGGQKRRVAIAGVLVMEPKVLVLDEPTAGLDPKGSNEVFRILSELNKNEGTTIVIISHNMDDVAAFCHRVAVMRDGEIMACDTVRNVFKRASELRSWGLDVPQISELMGRMAKEGYSMPVEAMTVQEGLNAVESLIKSQGGICHA